MMSRTEALKMLEKLKPGESCFLLRAQDVSAPYAVDQWIEMNESALGAEHPKIVGAKAIRDAMHQYPNRRQAD